MLLHEFSMFRLKHLVVQYVILSRLVYDGQFFSVCIHKVSKCMTTIILKSV